MLSFRKPASGATPCPGPQGLPMLRLPIGHPPDSGPRFPPGPGLGRTGS